MKMETVNTNEMIKVTRTIERDGVLIEETIEVPREEAKMVEDYLASTTEVKNDNQEEHSPVVTGEMASTQAEEPKEEGRGEEQGVLGETSKPSESEGNIYKESAVEFAARDSMESGAKQVDGVIVIDDPTYPAEDLPNDLFDSGCTDDEENQDIYAMMNDAYSDFDDDDDDVYEILEEFDDDE